MQCFSGEIAGTAGLVSDYGIGLVCWPRFDCKHKKIHGHFFKIIAAYVRSYQKLARKFHLMSKSREVDGDLSFNLPLESKDQKANSQDLFHRELIFGPFIRGKMDAS